MQIERAKAEDIARQAMAALQKGDGALAQQGLQSLVDGGHDTAAMCVMLARACRLSGDAGAEVKALDRALAKAPENASALLMRGRCAEQSGDVLSAASYFQKALAVAQGGGVPADAAEDIRHARGFLQQRADEFRRCVAKAVEGVDAGSAAAAQRLQHSVDILGGEREIYPQQPSVHYYPYLAQRQFFEREEFDWAEELEGAAPAIREELSSLLRDDSGFKPYVQPLKDRPPRDFHGLVDNPSWSAFYLWQDGQRVEDNAARCPRTMAALEKVPLSRIGSRTPSVLFSRLLPGAHIPPHNGMLNSRLICHLPLIIPEGCWLRVGNETREWQEGKLLIFDDSIEHEAKNPTGETRIILLFDIWRPEITQPERDAISAIFDAIDQFQGVPADR